MLANLFSNKSKKKSTWKNTLGTLAIIALGAIPFLIGYRCSEMASPDLAKVALVKNGKTYMLTFTSYKEINESVPLDQFVEIYKDDEQYYIQPSTLKKIVSIMGGNVDLFDFKEASYDGYCSINNKDTLYLEKSELRSSSTIGEQIRKTTATIRNKANKTMNISWSFSDKTNEFTAGTNCEIRSFLCLYAEPGERSTYYDDFLVIPLSRLAKFYGCKVTYDEDTKVLYIKT